MSQIEWTDEAHHAANFLVSMRGGHTTLERDDLRALLMNTGGQLLAAGRLYDIKCEPLGAGVTRVSLKPWSPGD